MIQQTRIINDLHGYTGHRKTVQDMLNRQRVIPRWICRPFWAARKAVEVFLVLLLMVGYIALYEAAHGLKWAANQIDRGRYHE